MHARESEILGKDIKHKGFTVGRDECSLVHHKVFGCSECLADEGRILLGELATYCFLT